MEWFLSEGMRLILKGGVNQDARVGATLTSYPISNAWKIILAVKQSTEAKEDR